MTLNRYKFFVLLIFLTACSAIEEDSVQVIQSKKLKIQTRSVKSIYTGNSENWKDNFIYNQIGNLEKHTTTKSGGTETQFEYNNNERVFRIKYQSLNAKNQYKLDSFLYYQDGKISTICTKFNTDRVYSDQYSMSNFYYDLNDKLKSITYSYYSNNGKITFYDLYYWKNDNIIRSEYYSDKNELEQENFFEYDDKINPLQNLLIEFNIYQPHYWLKNNVTLLDEIDYTGAWKA